VQKNLDILKYKIEVFISNNIGMLRFITVATTVFAVFLLVYELYLYGSDQLVVYLELCAAIASEFLNLFFSLETVVVETHGTIKSKILSEAGSKLYVIVAHGCDASTVFAVLIATIAAWPGRWPVKIGVILLGLLVMFGLNILRIAGMLLVEIHWPEKFDLFHEGILPSLLVAGALVYFYIWTLISGAHPSDT